MSIPIFSEIEKLINEHGSAVILKERLDLAKDKYDALETRHAELEEKVKQLETEKSKFQLENLKLKENLQLLESQMESNQAVHLNDIQERILILLSKTTPTISEQIAHQLQIGPELANFHLNELEGMNYVTRRLIMMSPPKWSLGQEGRRYLVSNDLLH
jgi:predicted nuclease with TOPRIM domain